MKKLLVAAFILMMCSHAAATTIGEEKIEVDLEDSSVQKQIEVKELTSSTLRIFTPAKVTNLEATVDGEPIDCRVFEGDIESTIDCDTSKERNFTVDLNFTAENLVETRNNRDFFSYSRDFIRPTERFTLKVILPKGSGIVDGGDISEPTISPDTDNIGSNGRRITVEWSSNPTIGESQSYRIVYESLSNSNNLINLFLAAFGALIVLTGLVLGFRYLRRDEIETVYDELEEDQVEVLDLLAENDGEMLQKDVVNMLDYSKAKISSTVSELVDKEIITKAKEGRSNKLKLSKKYKT